MVVLAVIMALAALIAGLAGRSRPPFELKLVSMEPCGVLEEDGTQPWLVTFSLSNPAKQGFQLAGEWIAVEAKVGDNWIDIKHLGAPFNLGGFHRLWRQSEREMQFLVPQTSETFRLRLNYQGERLRIRVAECLGPGGIKFVQRSPKISRWLWGKYGLHGPEYFRVPPHWKEAAFEVPVPHLTAVTKDTPRLEGSLVSLPAH